MSFSQLCRPKSRVLSEERKREIATLLNNEGFKCKPGERVSVPGVGLNLSKRECYELALSMDPTLAEAYYNLGTVLTSGEQANLGALRLTEGECFRRAVELDSTIAAGWYNLGVSLKISVINADSYEGEQQQQQQQKSFFFVREDEFTYQDVLYVMVNGKDYSKRDCYIRALEIDKTMAYCFFNLGVSLSSANDVALIKNNNNADEEEETAYSDLDCFVSALNLDSAMPAAWAMAGRRLSNIESSDEAFCGKNINLSNAIVDNNTNNTATEDQNSSSSAATTTSKKPTIRVGTNSYNAHECFVESLKLDPLCSSVWFLAGVSLETDQAVFDLHGKLFDKQSAFEMSLEKFEHRSVVWYELGSILLRKKRRREQLIKNSGTMLSYAFVKSEKCTPLICFTRCLELDDLNAKAWFNAGVLLSKSEVIKINGEDCSEKICFERCLGLDPTIGLCWYNLASTLTTSSSSKGIVGEQEYSRGECLALCLSQNPRHRDSFFHLGKYLEEIREDKNGENDDNINNLSLDRNHHHHQLVNGEAMTATNCYEKCIELDNKDISAWKCLVKSLNKRNGEGNHQATIRGKIFSRDDCMKMIIMLNSSTTE